MYQTAQLSVSHAIRPHTRKERVDRLGEDTSIGWCDGTFNPWHGCVEVSPACDHCYAKAFAKRVGFSETGAQFPIWGKDAPRRFFGDKHWQQPLAWNAKAEFSGIRFRVFSGSMCDVMEDRRDLDPEREKLYRLIEQTPQLDWLLLTKRPQNFRRFLPQTWLDSPRHNVWGMATVESDEYRWRVDALADTPFVVRGLSCEPILSDLHLGTRFQTGKIQWCIVGAESGPRPRPANLVWVRGLLAQCLAFGVDPFVKQLGSKPYDTDFEGALRREKVANIAVRKAPSLQGFTTVYQSGTDPIQIRYMRLKDAKGADMEEWPADLRVRSFPAPLSRGASA